MKRSINFRFITLPKKYVVLVSVLILFLIGVFWGAIIRNHISSENEMTLLDMLSSVFSANASVSKLSSFFIAAFINFIYFLFVFIFGVSLSGIPIIYIINLFKGFGIGFTVGFICKAYGSKGIAIALLSIFPQTLLFVVCLAIYSTIAIKYSYSLILLGSKGEHVKNEFPPVSILLKYGVLLFLLSLAGVLYETFISGFFISILV